MTSGHGAKVLPLECQSEEEEPDILAERNLLANPSLTSTRIEMDDSSSSGLALRSRESENDDDDSAAVIPQNYYVPRSQTARPRGRNCCSICLYRCACSRSLGLLTTRKLGYPGRLTRPTIPSTYKSLKAYSLLNTPWPYQTSSFDLLTCNGVLRLHKASPP